MSPDRLRRVVAGIASLMLLSALLAIGRGVPAWGLAVTAILMLVGLAIERWRYKKVESAAPPGFEPTAERFREPGSDREVAVFVNRATGERRYVKGR